MSLKKTVLSEKQKFHKRIEVVRIALSQGPQQALIRSGVPARTIGSWVRRFKMGGVDGLKDRSRAPHNVANKKDKDGTLGNALKMLHENEPGLNRLQIFSKLLIGATNEPPTMSWLARETRRLGLTKRPKHRVQQHKLRYEIPTPGALQIDTKFVQKLGEEGELLYQFTAIDECSRVRFLGGSLTKGAKAATQFLDQAIEFYKSIGVSVYQVQTDNGTEFTLPQTASTLTAYALGESDDSLFTQRCKQANIRHKLIRPRTPQLNGKVERSHRIDGARFYSRFSFSDAPTLDYALKHTWMPEYNYLRPHGALDGSTPMDFLRKRLAVLQNKSLESNLLNKNDSMSEGIKAA
jgi:transposase InsO family protein